MDIEDNMSNEVPQMNRRYTCVTSPQVFHYTCAHDIHPVVPLVSSGGAIQQQGHFG